MRHGQSQANADRIVAGSHESPLSEAGRRQVAYASETAKRYLPFDLIVTSPMSRARQSAEIIADHLGIPTETIVVMGQLRERNLGAVEGLNYAEAPQYNGNYEDAEHVDGVEPIEQLLSRMQEALAELRARPEQRILVVCHNGCGRMLQVAAANDAPMDMYAQPRLENAIFYPL